MYLPFVITALGEDIVLVVIKINISTHQSASIIKLVLLLLLLRLLICLFTLLMLLFIVFSVVFCGFCLCLRKFVDLFVVVAAFQV